MSYAISIISALGTAFGVCIAFLAFTKDNRKHVENDAEKSGELKANLDYIRRGVDDIRMDIKSQDNKIETIIERVAKVEESAKSAHHRIDELSKGE